MDIFLAAVRTLRRGRHLRLAALFIAAALFGLGTAVVGAIVMLKLWGVADWVLVTAFEETINRL
jgi:hypothetical protein